MNIDSINSMINDYERAETSLSNIRNLSALYNVRKYLKESVDNTTNELDDILPSYLKYVNIKRDYQRHKISEEPVYTEMKNLCKEIREFISSLYKCTDTQRERNILTTALKDMF